nr:HAMP domain-containing sensor histidine kinase [Micromonospora sp. NBRC 107566]
MSPARLRPRRWRHWTLRSRLAVSIAALAAVALVAANAAGLFLYRGYLQDRIDEQLLSISRPLSGQPPVVEPGEGLANRPRPRGEFGPGLFRYTYSPSGELITTGGDTGAAADLSPPALGAFADLKRRADGGRPFTVPSLDGAERWRVIAFNRGPTGGLGVLAVSMRESDATADGLLVIDLAVILGVLLLIALVAAWVVRLGLRPLTSMESVTAGIAAGDLSLRVADTDPHTEPGRLGAAMNAMLARIEAEVAARADSERRLRQFVADASHELRTPLTSIRGFAELYRRGGAPPGPPLDEAMGRIENEAARMGLLVEDLLLLARLDLQRPQRRVPVDLLEIAADTIRDAHARTPGRVIRLSALDESSETFEPVTVLGDEHRLRQVATNLVANALQHTPDSAEVTVRVGRLDPRVAGTSADRVVAVGPGYGLTTRAAVLEVSDTGPGVAAEHAQRVFERLYRVDPSRARNAGGSGLGLAIVAAIVLAHGGRVELDPGRAPGATFRVILPGT